MSTVLDEEDAEVRLLTEEEREAPFAGATAYYGVPVIALGEDGDYVVALGHVPLRRFLAAYLKYQRVDCGVPREDVYYAPESDPIRHLRALVVSVVQGGEWDSDWYADFGEDAQGHPDAVPVTVLWTGA